MTLRKNLDFPLNIHYIKERRGGGIVPSILLSLGMSHMRANMLNPMPLPTFLFPQKRRPL